MISEDSVISQLSRRDRQVLLRVAEGLHAASVQKQEAMKSSRTQKIVPPADVKKRSIISSVFKGGLLLVRDISAARHFRNFTRERAGFYVLRSSRMNVIGHSEVAFFDFQSSLCQKCMHIPNEQSPAAPERNVQQPGPKTLYAASYL